MLPDVLHDVIRSYRLGAWAEGSDDLVLFVDGLTTVLAGIANEPGGALVRLNSALEAAVAAQARGDYLFVADVLEHEVAPMLA